MDERLLGKRLCTGTNRYGEPCKRPPIAGGSVCPIHGGRAPQTKQAAYRMLLSLAEPALATLYDALGADCSISVMEGVALCDIHGASCPEWPVRVNAAKALLDRSGFGPHSTVSINDEHDLSNVPTEELAARLEALAAAARAEANMKSEATVANTIDQRPPSVN
jgi:hypothetical protein